MVSRLLVEAADLSQRPFPAPADKLGITGALYYYWQIFAFVSWSGRNGISLLLNAEKQSIRKNEVSQALNRANGCDMLLCRCLPLAASTSRSPLSKV